MRDEPEKASKILEELIHTADSPKQFIKRYITKKLESLHIEIETKKNEKIYNELCVKFPKYKNMIFVKYNVLMLKSAIEEKDDKKAQALFDKVKTNLKQFMINESQNNFNMSIKVVQLLRQIPELELEREIDFRQKKDPNYKIGKACSILINEKLDIYHNQVQINFDPIDLLNREKHSLFFHMKAMQFSYRGAIVNFVGNQMLTKRKLLAYIQEHNYFKALRMLKNRIVFLKNDDDKKCVQKVIDYLTSELLPPRN